MSTIEDKIEQLKEIRDNIKTAINDKYSNNPAGNCMTTYAELIRGIPTESVIPTYTLSWNNPVLNGNEKTITCTIGGEEVVNNSNVKAGSLVTIGCEEVTGYGCEWVVEPNNNNIIYMEKAVWLTHFIMPNDNVSGISCKFNPKYYSVNTKCVDKTVNIDITSLCGSISKDIIENTGTIENGEYSHNTNLRLTLPDKYHSKFIKWSDEATDSPTHTITITDDTTINAIYDIDYDHGVKLLECVNYFTNLNELNSFGIGNLSQKANKAFEGIIERDCKHVAYYNTANRGYFICVEEGYEIDIEGCKYFDIAGVQYDMNNNEIVKGINTSYNDTIQVNGFEHDNTNYTIYSIITGVEAEKIQFKIKLKENSEQ